MTDTPANSANEVRAACLQNSPPLRDLIELSLNRRGFMNVVVAGSCVALLNNPEGSSYATELSATNSESTTSLFHFRNVPPSQQDTVTVPEGYVAEVLYRWGDPINGVAPKFRTDASNTADEQSLQAGMGHDGMEFFAIPGQDANQRGLLAINHEYTDQVLLFRDGLQPMPPARMPLEKVRKSQASHGVSIIEVVRDSKLKWSVVDSPYSRRITAETPMAITGPATARLGTKVRGTVNNCAAGRTPWGTYLTCEENFHGVFGANQAFQPTAADQRYGLSSDGLCYIIDGRKVGAFRWWEQDSRFDLAKPDNDSNRFGFVVEIDPFDPKSTPIKHTALGRIKHENAELVIAPDGRIVVYMGDDEINEFVYKFVSANRWTPESNEPKSNYQKLLDEGTLYVARFDADGSGKWLALVPGENGIPIKKGPNDPVGFDAADICIRTRIAATIAGATPMDRPEWVSVNPKTKEVYVSLTNNRIRKEADGANPRSNNLFGHFLRWKEHADDPTSLNFTWQVFVLAGNPAHKEPTRHGNVIGDSFGCPDGLKFDSTGTLWIQTDMSSSVMGKEGYAELGNNMMLAADPVSREARRFLTGPRGCEITGMSLTPDRTTMFVNIQHPGEPSDDVSDPLQPTKYSNWPDGVVGGRPRSATIAIRKLDGGTIGS